LTRLALAAQTCSISTHRVHASLIPSQTSQKPVRAIYEVPAGRNFAVGDITIYGRPIRFGAQIVDFITMKLTGLATRIGASVHPPIAGCKQRKAQPGLGAPDVAAAISPRPHTR
jgi:hypothetical protein